MNELNYWDAKCRHVSNCCTVALWLYLNDYRAFTETIPCHRKRCRPSRSGRPRVTTATDDLYIGLQHLPNRHLTAAATGRQYGIHPQTQKEVETKRSTYSCVPTVLRSNSHPTSSNGKAGLVPASPALRTC